MNDFILVQIDKRINNLAEIVHDLHLNQTLSSFNQLVQSLIRTYFQQNVNVLVVLKHMLKFNDVRMAQWFVNFDLCYQLHEGTITFCLARDRFKELLAIILAADIFFVSKLVTS